MNFDKGRVASVLFLCLIKNNSRVQIEMQVYLSII